MDRRASRLQCHAWCLALGGISDRSKQEDVGPVNHGQPGCCTFRLPSRSNVQLTFLGLAAAKTTAMGEKAIAQPSPVSTSSVAYAALDIRYQNQTAPSLEAEARRSSSRQKSTSRVTLPCNVYFIGVSSNYVVMLFINKACMGKESDYSASDNSGNSLGTFPKS